MANLVILAGLPGSGKSTWAKRLLKTHRIVSSDEIRTRMFSSLDESEGGAHESEKKAANNALVFTVFHQEIRDHLRSGADTVADATNLNDIARHNLREIAEDVGAETHVILFTNVAQALLRNKLREGDRQVPESAMDTMLQKYMDTLMNIDTERYSSIIRVESFD